MSFTAQLDLAALAAQGGGCGFDCDVTPWWEDVLAFLGANAPDFMIAGVFATSVSLIFRATTKAQVLPKWWWGISIVPLLSVGMALAVILLPRPIPDGWQEGDFDTGFADFMEMVFFGAIVPIAYLAVALPVAFVVRLWKARQARA